MADIEQKATAAIQTAVTKNVSFFEKNPKATAIGAGIAGVIAGFLIAHFI